MIFQQQDYKDFVREKVRTLPKEGHGEFRRMAQHLGVSSTLISQVFKGDKHLSLEMAAELCDYFQLSDNEADYFLLLVEFAKAGSHKLKEKLKRKIQQEQKKAEQLTHRIKKDMEMSEETKAIYYSSWIYSGIRNLSAIESFQDVDQISKRLNLPRNQVQKIVEFLLAEQLCVLENGKLTYGPAWTHIAANSLLIPKHHQNWRLQGFQKMVQSDDANLFYTAPMSMSVEVAQKIRQELPEFIDKVVKMVRPSPSEVVRCLNIDYFEY
ncbi:MAG: TIGR02147 family protein [Pseudobdellovibrionaceae bacterium]|jgi:uncharacterized protein (TIGR02147 family)